MRTAPLVASLATLVAVAETARPCGLSPPIGPNGLPTVCRGDEGAVRLRASLSGGGTRTQIDFAGRRAPLIQGAVIGGLDVTVLDRFTFTASGGAALGGRVELDGVAHSLRPGWIAGLAASARVLDGQGLLPFVQVSLGYSVAAARSRAPDGAEATFTSKDWRVGVAVGKVVGGATPLFAPFVAARIFGAGTDWAPGGGKGSDAYRFHVAAGAAVPLGARLDVLAEVAFLGEQRLSVGVGASF